MFKPSSTLVFQAPLQLEQKLSMADETWKITCMSAFVHSMNGSSVDNSALVHQESYGVLAEDMVAYLFTEYVQLDKAQYATDIEVCRNVERASVKPGLVLTKDLYGALSAGDRIMRIKHGASCYERPAYSEALGVGDHWDKLFWAVDVVLSGTVVEPLYTILLVDRICKSCIACKA